MKHIIITNCTKRKRSSTNSSLPLVLNSTSKQSIPDVVSTWHDITISSKSKYCADEIYVGRSIAESIKSKQLINAELYFISTGYGLISSRNKISNYDLTLKSGPNALSNFVIPPFHVDDWWIHNQRIRNNSSIKDLMEKCDGLVLVSLGSSYLSMIRSEFELLSDQECSRLRIFTSIPGANQLPQNIRRYVLPYSSNFDGVNSPNPGTLNDYPQRILSHYVNDILPMSLQTYAEEQEFVHQLMLKMAPKKIKFNKQASDEDICLLISNFPNSVLKSCTKSLRYLRIELEVACEQKRFAHIFKQAKEII